MHILKSSGAEINSFWVATGGTQTIVVVCFSRWPLITPIMF